MHIDLQKDLEKVGRYIKRRTQDYPKYVNFGPGRDEDPVSMVTLGFEFDKPAWVALVFDTRSGVEPDGQWQNHIEGNSIEFRDWAKAYESLYFAKEPMIVKRQDGSQTSITECNANVVAKCFGESLRFALLSLRDDGAFAGIPVAENCVICVEHHEGEYGSIDRLDGRK